MWRWIPVDAWRPLLFFTSCENMPKNEKYLNLIFLILNSTLCFCGLLITFQASFTLAQNAPYLDFAGSKFKGPLIVLIIIGSCVCAFGVAGCIAAFKANHVLQFLGLSGILLLSIVQICTFVAALSLKGKVPTDVRDNMMKAMRDYSEDQTDRFDEIQRNFKCCGVTSFMDWIDEAYAGCNISLPISCCVDVNDQCPHLTVTQDYTVDVQGVHLQGCGQFIAEYVSKSQRIVNVACAITIVIEISCLGGIFNFLWKEKLSKVVTYEAVLSRI